VNSATASSTRTRTGASTNSRTSIPRIASCGTTCSAAARCPAKDNLAALPASYEGQRRRTYDDRIINTFEGGFVIQYTLHGVQHSGHKGALWICIVGLCSNGRITRIDEYMDSGRFPAWRGARPAARENGS